MTLDEVREVLRGAAWTRETPLVALLDEIVEQHDEPITDAAGKRTPGAITQAFADYERSHVSSGRVVQLLIGLRMRCKLPLYILTPNEPEIGNEGN